MYDWNEYLVKCWISQKLYMYMNGKFSFKYSRFPSYSLLTERLTVKIVEHILDICMDSVSNVILAMSGIDDCWWDRSKAGVTDPDPENPGGWRIWQFYQLGSQRGQNCHRATLGTLRTWRQGAVGGYRTFEINESAKNRTVVWINFMFSMLLITVQVYASLTHKITLGIVYNN